MSKVLTYCLVIVLNKHILDNLKNNGMNFMKFALSCKNQFFKSKEFFILTTTFSAFCFSASAFATIQPLTFTAKPTFPQVVNRNTTYTLNYTIKNNLPSVTLPLSFSGAVSAGTLTPSSGSCGSTLSGGQTCTKSFLYTAPSTGQTVTGSVIVNYGGRYRLTDSTVNLLIPSTSIAANTADALFSFSDSNPTGSVGTGKSTITITNNESISANNIAPVTPLPSNIILQSNTCGSSLVYGATCALTFSTASTPDATQAISIKGSNTNVITLPIAPLSIRVYSSAVNPSPSNASLMLVTGCTIPELLTVTNNTSSVITDITAASDAGLTGITTNVTTCPSALSQNQTCLIGITTNTATTGNSGNILFGWNGASAQGAILAGVEASNSPTLPALSTPSNPVTVFGGYVYDKNTACNLVKLSALTDQYIGTGSVAVTTPAYITTTVPNLGSSSSGARSYTDGQTNSTAIIFQASPGINYGAGLCAQYVEANSGNNYVGWYLPASDELNTVYTNLKNGDGTINGFSDQKYLASTEDSASFGRDQHFYTPPDEFPYVKYSTDAYVRCVRTLTY